MERRSFFVLLFPLSCSPWPESDGGFFLPTVLEHSRGTQISGAISDIYLVIWSCILNVSDALKLNWVGSHRSELVPDCRPGQTEEDRRVNHVCVWVSRDCVKREKQRLIIWMWHRPSEPRCVFLTYVKTEYKKWSVWHCEGFLHPTAPLKPASADVPVNAVLKLHFHLISNFKIMNPKLEKFIKICFSPWEKIEMQLLLFSRH